jgi:hypothetical protein
MNRAEAKSLEILDQCLSRVQAGAATIHSCLETYPELREEFEPLLAAALRLRSQLAPSGPNPGFASNAKIRILNQIQAKRKKQITRPRDSHRRRLAFRPAYAILGLIMIFGLLGSGYGVINASGEALPGDALYGIKRAVEETRLALTWSAAGDVDLLMQFADKRLEEMNIAFSAGLDSTAELALMEYEGMLARLLDLADDESLQNEQETVEKIHNGIAHHEEVLKAVLEEAPAAAQAGIERALEKSSHGKAVLEQLEQGLPPSDLAPGQEKKITEPADNPTEEREQDKSKEKTPGPPSENENAGPKPKDKTPGPPEDKPDKQKKEK